jgi:hypothetical protein
MKNKIGWNLWRVLEWDKKNNMTRKNKKLDN